MVYKNATPKVGALVKTDIGAGNIALEVDLVKEEPADKFGQPGLVDICGEGQHVLGISPLCKICQYITSNKYMKWNVPAVAASSILDVSLGPVTAPCSSVASYGSSYAING